MNAGNSKSSSLDGGYWGSTAVDTSLSRASRRRASGGGGGGGGPAPSGPVPKPKGDDGRALLSDVGVAVDATLSKDLAASHVLSSAANRSPAAMGEAALKSMDDDDGDTMPAAMAAIQTGRAATTGAKTGEMISRTIVEARLFSFSFLFRFLFRNPTYFPPPFPFPFPRAFLRSHRAPPPPCVYHSAGLGPYCHRRGRDYNIRERGSETCRKFSLCAAPPRNASAYSV